MMHRNFVRNLFVHVQFQLCLDVALQRHFKVHPAIKRLVYHGISPATDDVDELKILQAKSPPEHRRIQHVLWFRHSQRVGICVPFLRDRPQRAPKRPALRARRARLRQPSRPRRIVVPVVVRIERTPYPRSILFSIRSQLTRRQPPTRARVADQRRRPGELCALRRLLSRLPETLARALR